MEFHEVMRGLGQLNFKKFLGLGMTIHIEIGNSWLFVNCSGLKKS